MNDLEKIQNEAGGIVSGETKLVALERLYRELIWLKLSGKRRLHKLYFIKWRMIWLLIIYQNWFHLASRTILLTAYAQPTIFDKPLPLLGYIWFISSLHMRRMIWGFAGGTYHIVGNLMHWLNYCLTLALYSQSQDGSFSNSVHKMYLYYRRWFKKSMLACFQILWKIAIYTVTTSVCKCIEFENNYCLN